MKRLRVAIGEQLKGCPQVITLGVRPQLSDYTTEERGLIRGADRIFYPTLRFVDIFATLGKETFPSVNCYRLLGDKLKQTALFCLLDITHPRTRVYYGPKQKRNILKDFVFPLVAKKPFRSSKDRHVFLIRDQEELDWYNEQCNPAYIQEYVPGEGELKIVVLNYNTLLGYWRASIGGDLKGCLTRGEALQIAQLPAEAVSVAKYIASAADLSDVAVDMILDGNQIWVIELDFRYGNSVWRQAGQDRIELIMEMISNREL